MQAAEAFTTRRALFSRALSTAAVVSLAAIPLAAQQDTDWPAFISTMAFMHPNGEATALHAYNAGMKLEDIFGIWLFRERDADEHLDDHMPVLCFKLHEGPNRTFSRWGEA